MTDNDKRSASDIILALESKVDNLSRYVINIDSTIKILLGRINELSKNLENIKAVDHSNIIQEKLPPKGNFEKMAEKFGIAVEPSAAIPQIIAKPTGNSQLKTPDPDGDEIIEELSGRNSAIRGQRVQTKSVKSSISQQLLKEDGGILFLANVEIINKKGELVKQTRTNMKGRWMAALDPEEYTVKVTKRFSDGNQRPIEKSYEIKVPPSDSPMELDPLTLG
jgi:hypothetical protein